MEFKEEDMISYEDLFTFGYDCIKACMEAYGIEWTTSYSDPRSHEKRCTKPIYGLMKLAPRITAMKIENKLFTYFEGWFDADQRSCCEKDFETFAEFLTSELCLEDFKKESFIHFCVMIGHMSVKLYSEGIIEAPDYAFCCIAYALIHFKTKNQFDESTWTDLDSYAISVLTDARVSASNNS